jgi:hypothetical protein
VELNFDKFSIAGQHADVYVPYMRVDGHHGLTNSIHLIHSLEACIEEDYTSRLFRGRPLTLFVDIALIKHWLEICERSHDGCRKTNGAGTQELRHSIRVIDINKRCVVESAANCKYVALSYVWGGPDMPQLKLQKNTASRLLTPGGLSESCTDIPLTIVDSMKFCSLIGRDYLWVDALCIEQDNLEDQSRQIHQMDKIYALADFTIVPAFGPELFDSCNSWSGLPGISKSRISRQRIEKIRGQQFGNPASGRFLQNVHLFFWSRRAWTMQEMYLSRRLIYFTEFQTYYQCGETVWREDQYLECDKHVRIENSEYDPADMGESKLQFIKETLDRTGSDSFRKYCQLVTGICSRAMTNPGDILHAFTGISNIFSSSMKCQMVWGLPTSYFDYALLFESLATIHIRRRPGFPSWTWAGWKEPDKTNGDYPGSLLIYYDTLQDYVMFNEVEWYSTLLSDPNNSNNHHQEEQRHGLINSKIPKASSVSVLDTVRSSWRPSSLMERSPVPDGLTKEEQYMLLIFQTSCATIDVVYNSCALGGVFDTLLSSDGLKRTINLRREAAAANRKGIRRIQENDFEIRKVEFLVLGTVMLKENQDKEPSTVNVYLKLMAIQTDHRGVSERIGLVDDKVAVCDWVAWKPQWRTVFLL